MKTFAVYLFLEYKKSVKVLLKSAASLALTAGLLLAGAAVLSHVVFGSQMFQAIDVGVAVPDGEKETKAVVRFLSAMESVEAVCNFRYFPQDEAMEKLYEGEVQAVIVLPESLYEDMYTGQQGRISVYLPEDPPFRVQVFRELLSDGVSLLMAAEAGVLASSDMAEAEALVSGDMAEATVPAAVGLALILLMPGHRGAGRETVSMVLFVLVCSFWVTAVGRLFRNSTAFAGWTLTILLLQMAVCPVFVDLAAYVPAVKVIRWGFPLGWLG